MNKKPEVKSIYKNKSKEIDTLKQLFSVGIRNGCPLMEAMICDTGHHGFIMWIKDKKKTETPRI